MVRRLSDGVLLFFIVLLSSLSFVSGSNFTLLLIIFMGYGTQLDASNTSPPDCPGQT